MGDEQAQLCIQFAQQLTSSIFHHLSCVNSNVADLTLDGWERGNREQPEKVYRIYVFDRISEVVAPASVRDEIRNFARNILYYYEREEDRRCKDSIS